MEVLVMTTQWLGENQDWLYDANMVNVNSQTEIDNWRKHKKNYRIKHDQEFGQPMWQRLNLQSRRFVVLQDKNCYHLFESLAGGEKLTEFQKSNYLLKHSLFDLLLSSDIGRWEGLRLKDSANAFARQWHKYFDDNNCLLSHFAIWVWAHLRDLDKALSLENDQALDYIWQKEGCSLAEYCLQQMPNDWFQPKEKAIIMWLLQNRLMSKLLNGQIFLGIDGEEMLGEAKEMVADMIFKVYAQAADRANSRFADLYDLSYKLWLCEKLSFTVDGWGIPQEDAQISIKRGKTNYIEIHPTFKKNKVFFEEYCKQVLS